MLPNIKLLTALFGLKVRQMKQMKKHFYFLINVYQMVVTYSVTLNTINMALIKCTECGEMISDKATVCPHCGAPIEKWQMWRLRCRIFCWCWNVSKLWMSKFLKRSEGTIFWTTQYWAENSRYIRRTQKRVQHFLVENRQNYHRASSMRLGTFFLTSQMNNGRPSNTSHSKTLPCCLFFLYW